MEKIDNPAEMMQELLADLSPEELEPRLELQVFIDPMLTLATSENNVNGGNNNIQPQPPKDTTVIIISK